MPKKTPKMGMKKNNARTQRAARAGFVRRLLRWADNLKLRSKMLLIFVVCALIPVVATDLIFFSMVSGAEHERMNNKLDDTVDSVVSSIRSSLGALTSTTVAKYTSAPLYEYLDKQYESRLDYLNAYVEYNRERVILVGNNLPISSISYYVDNDTIVNGGGYYNLSNFRNSNWYKQFLDNNMSMSICCYESTNRTISVVRRLDYHLNNDPEKLIKVDLNYNFFLRNLMSQHFDTHVYICEGDNVLFSTSEPSYSGRYFSKTSDLDLSKAVRHVSLNCFQSTWDVYLVEQKDMQSSVLAIIQDNITLFGLLVLVNLIVPFSAILLIDASITRRLRVLGRHFDMVKDEDFREIPEHSSSDEIGGLIKNYNLMVHKIENLIRVVYKERLIGQENELERQRAELQALHAQINPHFMFNALESIRMRSLLKNETETADVIELLALMMRKSTDWGSDYVTVEDEVRFCETYLKLQQYRFGQRLSYSITVDERCCELLLPKLTLVTFVENACVHGVEGVIRDSSVILSVELDNGDLVFYIEDTGIGMDEQKCAAIAEEMKSSSVREMRGAKSVGMLNACLRLRKCFDEQVAFDVDSEPNVGTCITIRIASEKIRERGSLDA